MSATPNPYAPPKANVDDVVPAGSDAEVIRREHIKHEASIRSVGMLYYISATFVILAGLALLVPYLNGMRDEALTGVLAFVYPPLGVLSIFIGRGLRSLRPWARTTCIVLSAIGLLGFPMGTVINGYILYLMLSKKGKRIFESDYPGIVAATPDIKYRTSIVIWILLVLLLLLIALAIFGMVMRQS